MSYGSFGSGRYSTSGYGSYGSGSRKSGSYACSYYPRYSSYFSHNSSFESPSVCGYQLRRSKSEGSSSEVVSERVRHRYESSSHASSDTSADALSRHSSISCSQSSLNEEEIRNYKELYDEIKKENERLKEALLIAEEELERMKMQMQKLSQNNAIKSSLNDTEKKEKRSLERKLSEMEEEMKNVSKLKTENDKLKAENRALSRVVCKLSK